MNNPRFCRSVYVSLLGIVFVSFPVSSFAADAWVDPYDASYADGHFLNPPPVYLPPASSGQQSPNSATVTTDVSDQQNPRSNSLNPLPVAASPLPDTATTPSTYADDTSIDLGTRSGFELGGQVSYYRYQEHVVADTEFMHETGPKVGMSYDHIWCMSGLSAWPDQAANFCRASG